MALTEAHMEYFISEYPNVFIEDGLKLVKRQLTIGNYRFDLLFEDRIGAKLIVELQRGTLDRNHLYKILDYYHQYKEQNPSEYTEIMVIANLITVERKTQLQNHGIEFLEIPESLFLEFNETLSIKQRIRIGSEKTEKIEKVKVERPLTEYMKFAQKKRLEGLSFREISKLWKKEKNPPKPLTLYAQFAQKKRLEGLSFKEISKLWKKEKNSSKPLTEYQKFAASKRREGLTFKQISKMWKKEKNSSKPLTEYQRFVKEKSLEGLSLKEISELWKIEKINQSI